MLRPRNCSSTSTRCCIRGRPSQLRADAQRYTERDLYVSPETAEVLEAKDTTNSGPVVAFKAWCAEEGRVAVPCTTATYTEYGALLMRRGLKVSTIRNYMSLIKSAMPAGKRPDNRPFPRELG
ncbi:hypothetical protein AB0D13_13545 [Streptomyces sp. NPDC048430]|uniref:hypothetical protein n=1 Tax=Streptomyces sp. NPDC048430 TaxID=3155388 RepID=UPI00344A0064